MPRLTIVLITCLLAVVPVWAQQGKAVEELAKHWKTSKEFTLAVAEAMPDGHYDFKAVSEEMSFAEVLDHIARAQAGSFARVANAKSPVAKPDKMDKAAVIKEITDSFDFCLKALASMPDAQLETLLGPAGKQSTAREAMLGAFTHTAAKRKFIYDFKASSRLGINSEWRIGYSHGTTKPLLLPHLTMRVHKQGTANFLEVTTPPVIVNNGWGCFETPPATGKSRQQTEK